MTQIYNRKEQTVPYQDDYGKGYKRHDPRMASIKVGSPYVIRYKDYKSDRPHDKLSRIYFCFKVNQHGVYYFQSFETDRVLALTWVEILEKIDAGGFKPAKVEMSIGG